MFAEFAAAWQQFVVQDWPTVRLVAVAVGACVSAVVVAGLLMGDL